MNRRAELLPPYILAQSEDVQAKYFQFQCHRLRAFQEKSDWSSYVFLHQSQARISVLMNLMDQMPFEEFVSLDGEVWNDASQIATGCDFLGSICLYAKNKGKDIGSLLMHPHETQLLDRFVDGTIAYRAHEELNALRCSWYLDHEWALRHAECFGSRFVSKCSLNRDGIIAIFDRGHAIEVIVDIQNITITETDDVFKRQED